jgi:hypothetical protein
MHSSDICLCSDYPPCPSMEFGTIMVWFFVCDRTHLLRAAGKVSKMPQAHSPAVWAACLAR